ncbi:GNAT family N-acetyltransferase [Lacinutrix salivirga]
MIHYTIYTSVKTLPNSWDALPHNDLFLTTKFLEALECSCPQNITPFYVGIFKAETLIGIAILQRVEMYLDDIFRNTKDNYLTRITKQLVSKIVRGNALVIGNLMHTGQHGLYFKSEAINYETYLNILGDAIEAIRLKIKKENNKKIRIIAFKDYFENDAIHNNTAFFKQQNLYKVQVQPNMVFNIPEHWKTLEDYKAEFTKKYRQRFNSARNKAKSIIKKELDLATIKQNQTTLFELYKNVSDNARVNSFILNEAHFSHIKEELQDHFKVFGYFLNEELIGFYTLILNNDKLETYFLGYNPLLQNEYKIYLNMLYDMAQFGIENGFKTIVYARTAMEIKSSIGAKPKMMHIYMKHTNSFIANTVLKFIVKYLNPTTNWVERHPFKP